MMAVKPLRLRPRPRIENSSCSDKCLVLSYLRDFSRDCWKSTPMICFGRWSTRDKHEHEGFNDECWNPRYAGQVESEILVMRPWFFHCFFFLKGDFQNPRDM